MPDENTQLDTVAIELRRARIRAGLTHSDLNRLTGISRSVLSGYETGRTRPGAKEIRLLCDALKVSPNRLILGVDEPEFDVGQDALPSWLRFDSNDEVVAKAAMLIHKLGREEQRSILLLAHSILEARYGSAELEKMYLVMEAVSQNASDYVNQEKLSELGERLEQIDPPSIEE